MQAHVEEMLVRWATQIVVDHAAPFVLFAGWHGGGLDDAGEFCLELDRAVLVQVPVEAVVVIADGREERDDEAPRAADLEQAVAEFVVLPGNSVIFFMHADGVLHDEGLALVVGGRHVEIMDIAEAVAAELERVGEHAEPVFTGIERRLPEMVLGRIGIGHHHLGNAGAMDQRALACTVLVGELMQHQALARREADAKAPFLPVDLPAIDLEARALRLFDMQRLDVGARIFDFMRAVIPLLARDRHDRVCVREVDDLAADQVDRRRLRPRSDGRSRCPEGARGKS